MSLFDASEIDKWADKPEATYKLPELIRRLVMATVPTLSLLDMPSGSSVWLPGWDGLIEVKKGNAWVPDDASAWELSTDKRVTNKANEDYEKRTADPQGVDMSTTTFVFVTPRRWTAKRKWVRERRAEGKWAKVRAYDAEDLVAWLEHEQASVVARWFRSVIDGQFFDYEAMNRIEEHQIETKNMMSVGFADVANMKRTLDSIAAKVQTTDPEPIQDLEQQRLSERIDAARDLIQQGLIVSARTLLQRIEDEVEELPDTLRFRLATNLAVCALGEGKFDEASSLIEEAHIIQPENPVAITNAALAAQLQQNPKRAAELAQKALAIDTRDSNAAAKLIWALWDMGESEQLEGFVASEEWITQESASASALARVRALQARYDNAIIIYRSLIDTDPDDAQAHLGLSQCLLTHAQVDRLPDVHSNEALTKIREAEIEADRAIELLKPTQFYARRHEALVLRAVARALLEKVDEAMRDVDAVLGETPKHPVATLNKGLILLKKGLPGEARKCLESIQDPEVRADSLLPLADACRESGDATAAITLLKGSFKLDPPGTEDLGRAESLLRAEAATGNDDSVGPVLEAAIERYPNDPGLFILDAVRSDLEGDTEASAAALTKAIELAGEPHRRAIQTQLGYLYESMRRFADAAKQFAKACDNDASHPAAVPMLLSLFNSRQYRNALDLARKIREVDDSTPRVVIEVEAEILGHVGDAGRAALLYRELCSQEDSTPDDLVRLALAQFRCGERDAALETIREIDVSQLGRDSQILMKLAYMKRFLGSTDYIHDAYLSLRYGLNDPDAYLGYFRLFLGLGRNEEWEEPIVVGPGCAVRIKSGGEEQWWQILEDGEESYGPRDLSSEHDLAQRLLGQSVGYVVELRQGLGGLSYEITDLQSKYVRAYQEILGEFGTRFPDNLSLSRIELDSDFTQIFQSIELRDQHFRNAGKLYQSGKVPFVSFCDLIGRSTLEVWAEYTAQPSGRLHFGTGSEQETNEASALLRDANGIVLDITALLTVHRLELAKYLQTRFSRVAIPQQVFDEIQRIVYTMKMDGAPSSYVGKDDEGQYVLTEITENVWKKRQEYALSVLELAESFERIPSYPMLAVNEPEKTIGFLPLAVAGALYAGDEQSEVRPVLASDDLLQSDMARSLGLGVVNSQALLIELLRSDVIKDREYSSKIEELVLLNYWLVRISPQDILQSLETNGYQTTPGMQAMLRTLGGPDCTEDAAAAVGAEVVASLAKGPVIQQQLDLLLSSVVAEIRRGRDTNRVLLKFKNEIAMRLRLAPFHCTRILQTVDLYIRFKGYLGSVSKLVLTG